MPALMGAIVLAVWAMYRAGRELAMRPDVLAWDRPSVTWSLILFSGCALLFAALFCAVDRNDKARLYMESTGGETRRQRPVSNRLVAAAGFVVIATVGAMAAVALGTSPDSQHILAIGPEVHAEPLPEPSTTVPATSTTVAALPGTTQDKATTTTAPQAPTAPSPTTTTTLPATTTTTPVALAPAPATTTSTTVSASGISSSTATKSAGTPPVDLPLVYSAVFPTLDDGSAHAVVVPSVPADGGIRLTIFATARRPGECVAGIRLQIGPQTIDASPDDTGAPIGTTFKTTIGQTLSSSGDYPAVLTVQVRRCIGGPTEDRSVTGSVVASRP